MVYFIQGEQTRLIKIGRANNVARRLRELQTGSPDVLKVLAVLGGIRKRSDRAYHVRFKRDRIRGEWFRPSRVLLNFIATIAKSEFEELGIHTRRHKPKYGAPIDELYMWRVRPELAAQLIRDGATNWSKGAI